MKLNHRLSVVNPQSDIETNGSRLHWESNPLGTWVLGGWCPVLRWRESSLGFSVELWEPVALMLTEKSKWKPHEDESTDAENWGGPVCSSDEGAVMAVERRDRIRQSNLTPNCPLDRRRWRK